jgi:NodT family efflux transporter outer membrane factor (OMF) lipoprotein
MKNTIRMSRKPKLNGNGNAYPKRSPLLLTLALLLDSCATGPKYIRPPVATPTAFKELGTGTPGQASWKPAQPNDAAIRGKWWEAYNDPHLNELEEKLNTSNQSVAASYSSYLAARAIVKEAQSQFFPTAAVAPNVAVQGGQTASGVTGASVSRTYTQYSVPLNASWAPDLWGRVANTVKADVASAQVAQADLANERLLEQADLAVDYFELRNQDTLQELFDSSVRAFRETLELTKTLYKTGIDNDQAVAQAETQLETAEAQDTNLGIARAQFEHAIAVLIGQPASDFSLPLAPLVTGVPAIPSGVPSQLLERRPDVAAAERGMAAANAQIGVAIAAYYPSLTLNASAGVGSNNFAGLLALPQFAWSLGATLAETIFDAGLRGATVDQFKASYEQAVANYRETVLTAFQQVEDALAGLRILSREVEQQDSAVRSAQRSLTVAIKLYQTGIGPYLNVLTAQTALLTNQQTAATLRLQQMTTSVQLIEALGGGWNADLSLK